MSDNYDGPAMADRILRLERELAAEREKVKMKELAEKAEEELAKLKAHAEAMATWCALVNNGVCDFRTPMPHEEYRRDYPEGK